jgi:phosphopantetheine--protein transferase-like protein
MILGVGIDSVQVKRFAQWSSISVMQLKKIFSEEEIVYCLKSPRLSAQRFAVRFAVREAFFKALCSMQQKSPLPFLKVCKAVTLLHSEYNVPVLHIHWTMLGEDDISASSLAVHCSLTHTKDDAQAYVIIERC